MNKVLITGADGFIGSHLTEELIKKGYDVRAFVYYNSFNSWGWLDNLPSDVQNNLDVFVGDGECFGVIVGTVNAGWGLGCDGGFGFFSGIGPMVFWDNGPIF